MRKYILARIKGFSRRHRELAHLDKMCSVNALLEKDASPRSTRASCIFPTNESSRLRISERSKSWLTYRVYLSGGLRDTNERVDAR